MSQLPKNSDFSFLKIGRVFPCSVVFVAVWKLKTRILLRNKPFVFAVISFISSLNSKPEVFEKNIERLGKI